MASERRVFRNFIRLIAAQAVTMATGLITATVLTRSLLPENYGILGFSTALISYLGLVITFGTNGFAMREIARDSSKRRSLVPQVLGTRLIATFVVFAVVIWGGQYFVVDERIRLVLVIQSIGLLATAIAVDFYFEGVQKMGVIASKQVAAALLSVTAVIILIRSPDDIFIAAAIPVLSTLSTAVALLVGFSMVTRVFPFTLRLEGSVNLLRRSSPFALTAFMSAVYFNMDLVTLGLMRTNEEVGLYAAVTRVMVVSIVVANMLRSASLPHLAKSYGDTKAMGAAAEAFIRSVYFIGVPITVFGVVFAGPIIHILFGPAYAKAEQALIILMLAVGTFHAVVAYGSPLVAWNREVSFAAAETAGALGNVILNLILIPKFGILGAAGATLASHFLVAIYVAVKYRRAGHLLQVSALLKTVFAALVAGAVSTSVPLDPIGGPIVQFAVAAIVFGLVYLLAAIVFRAVRLSEIMQMVSGIR